MSILFGYDYFNETKPMLERLENKINQADKNQTTGTTAAEVTVNKNEITKLHSIVGQYAWYRYPNSIAYPPNSYKTDEISKSDVDNTKFIGFAMTDGSNIAPTMGAPLSFSTNSTGNVVLHMKNGNGLIRATFMYFITQDYLGSGGITIQVMSLKFRDVDASGTVTDRTGNMELLCYLVILQ
jgi:hypothetical protein